MESWSSTQVALGVLPFLFLIGFTLVRFGQGRDRAGSLIEAVVAWGAISSVASELLGYFRWLGFGPILAVWLLAVGVTSIALWTVRHRVRDFFAIERSLGFYIVGAYALVTLFIAITAAPNNWDSQAYHLPRIEHWIQNGSFAYYPSWNMRQNDFAPLSEILLLQTRLLSGTDFYYLLIQWISMVVGVAAAFRITRQFGGSREQCWIAAVFLVTLPIGILESTSTQNDYLEAAFLMAFVTFGIEAIRLPRSSLILVLAAAAGVMTGLVKPIGFMVGLGFAVWFAIALSRGITFRAWLRQGVIIALVSAVLLGPFAARFIKGAQTDDLGAMHFSSSFGVRQTLDTLTRHAVSNLAVGIPEIDSLVLRVAESITFRLGLQVHRADTSDPLRPVYRPPEGLLIYHEDLGPNQLHTVLLALALVAFVIGWPKRPSRSQWVYFGAWLGGVLVFASLIRFSLWEVRYHLPGFAAAAPIFAWTWPTRWAQSKKTVVLLCVMALASTPVLLLNQSRELLPLTRNWFPALGRDRPSYLPQTRFERLFTNQPQMLEPYRNAIDVIVGSGATKIGIILDRDCYEYGVWALLRDRKLGRKLRIESVGVPGATYWPLGPFVPDVIFWDREAGADSESIDINGQNYRRIHQSGPIIAHPNRVAVFQRVAAP